MAMMSDSEVRSLATTLENYETREKKREIEKRQEKKENHRKWMELLYTGAGVAGAAGIGFMHGRFEDDDGNFFIPRTTLNAKLGLDPSTKVAIAAIRVHRTSCRNAHTRRPTAKTNLAGRAVRVNGAAHLAADSQRLFRFCVATVLALLAVADELVGFDTTGHRICGQGVRALELGDAMVRTGW